MAPFFTDKILLCHCLSLSLIYLSSKIETQYTKILVLKIENKLRSLKNFTIESFYYRYRQVTSFNYFYFKNNK
jgi:hypothetical protein